MNDHIVRLKSQIETAEQREDNLGADLEASRTRERNLIGQIEKMGETVLKHQMNFNQTANPK
jgi:predicted  nucleic acid-binding Zn-ribbon protein